jgi:DHA1 family tetracycline resistance protein-like MFS transporter
MTRKPPGMTFIFVTLLLDVVGMGLLNPVTPALVASFVGGDLSAAAHLYGPLIGGYTLMQFLCAAALGAYSDQVGRKPVLLFSLGATALAYLMMAFAPNLVWLFIGRMLAGAAAASMTVASAYIADVSPPEQRAQNFGMLGAAFGIGFIIGPVLGGTLAQFGVTVPFLASAAVAGLNFLYGLVAVPESHKPENRRPFTWDKANPLSFVATLRSQPAVLGFVGTMLLVGLAQQFQQSTWVLFNTYRFGWSPAQNGASLAVAGLCMALVQGGLIRVVLPRLGEQRAIRLGLAVFALSLVLFGLVTHGWLMMAVVVGSSLAAIGSPALQSMISRQVGPEAQGSVQGALTSLMSLTGIIGPVVAAQLFAFGTSPASPVHIPGLAYFAGATLIVLALLTTYRFKASIPEAPAPLADPA